MVPAGGFPIRSSCDCCWEDSARYNGKERRFPNRRLAHCGGAAALQNEAKELVSKNGGLESAAPCYFGVAIMIADWLGFHW
jgi:hypothetical protein